MIDPDGSSTSSSEPPRRLAQLALSCLAVLVAFGLAVHAHREQLNEAGIGASRLESAILPRLARWSKPAVAGRTRVVLFGDSLNICADPRTNRRNTVGHVLRRALAEARVLVGLLDMTHPGLRPVQFYSLLGAALDGEPRAVMVEVNLRVLALHGANAPRAQLPHLARRLAFRDALRLREALAAHGLTVLDPAILQLKDRLGLLYAAEGLRSSFLDALASAGAAATQSLGLRHVPVSPLVAFARRFRPAGLVDYAALPDVAPLRAMRDAARERGVRILFYVSPVNLPALGGDGSEVVRTLPGRIDALRRAIGAGSEEWLDLHDRLPAGLFRDSQNHLRAAGCIRVGTPLAQRLLRVLHS